MRVPGILPRDFPVTSCRPPTDNLILARNNKGTRGGLGKTIKVTVAFKDNWLP